MRELRDHLWIPSLNDNEVGQHLVESGHAKDVAA